MNTTDPLHLLKHFFLNGKKIETEGDLIKFDSVSYKRDTKTNFLRLIRAPNNKEYYTVESILLYLRYIQSQYTAYIQAAAAEKVQIISFPHTKDLKDFFTGVTTECKNIDPTALIPNPITSSINQSVLPQKSVKNIELPNLRKETSISTQDMTIEGDLGKMMSVDDIAHLKIKRLAMKKSAVASIYPGDDDTLPEIGDDAEDSLPNKPAILTQFNEFTAKNRNSIMESTGKDFSNVLSLIASQRPFIDLNDAQGEPVVVSEVKEDKDMAAGLTYNRYDQERFKSLKDTAGFKINTLGSFKGLMSKMDSDNGVTANEPIQSVPVKRESKTPIIIVPKASSSLININTIVSFVQEFKLDLTAKNENISKDGNILVYRRKNKVINGQNQPVSIPYICLDNTEKLSGSDWNRVVAVFVHGPTWQFKGWPFLLPNNCPSEIFTRIHAFHVKYMDVTLDPQIAKWNVKILNILRNRRHMDRAAAVTFWDSLEAFISRNKPNLRF